MIERCLDAIIGEFLADLKCLTKFRVFRFPPIERADMNAQLFGNFEIGRACDTSLGGNLAKGRIVIGRTTTRLGVILGLGQGYSSSSSSSPSSPGPLHIPKTSG